GALSRYGLVAYASSLDQVGILAREVGYVLLAFDVMRGADEHDATSFGQRGPVAWGAGERWGAYAPDVAARCGHDTPGESRAAVRIGVVRELSGAGMSPAALQGLERAVAALRADGVEVVPVSLASVRHAVAAYYLIATAEASSNLARYDG